MQFRNLAGATTVHLGGLKKDEGPYSFEQRDDALRYSCSTFVGHNAIDSASNSRPTNMPRDGMGPSFDNESNNEQ